MGSTYRLLTDAYMAQHPDGDDSRQLQSVSAHLITLRAILVDGQPMDAASRITVQAINLGRQMGGYPRLDRPTEWASTIADVASAAVAPAKYARDVLSAWQPTEGDRVQKWARDTIKDLYRS